MYIFFLLFSVRRFVHKKNLQPHTRTHKHARADGDGAGQRDRWAGHYRVVTTLGPNGGWPGPGAADVPVAGLAGPATSAVVAGAVDAVDDAAASRLFRATSAFCLVNANRAGRELGAGREL